MFWRTDETTAHPVDLMNRIYRHQRHIYDFTRKYYLLGRDRMLDELRLEPNARVLEVGCGTARNLIRLGRMHPSLSLCGLDASDAMLQTAALAVARTGLSDRIALKRGFAEKVSPALFGLKTGFGV